MSEMELFVDFFRSVWAVFQTPITIPVFGTVTPLGLMVLFAAFSIVCDFIARMIGGRDT